MKDNPHKKDETVLRAPQDIMDEMERLYEESAEIMSAIRELV